MQGSNDKIKQTGRLVLRDRVTGILRVIILSGSENENTNIPYRKGDY